MKILKIISLFWGGGGDNGLNQVSLRDVDPTLVTSLGYPIFVDSEQPNDDTNYDATVFSNSKTGANNGKAYYIKDDTSISAHGIRKEPVVFKDIAPLPGSGDLYTDDDRQAAANETYKAAVRFLINAKDPQTTYNVTVVGKTLNFNVGDTVNLKFKGEVTRISKKGERSQRVYVDLDTDFYVVGIQAEYEDAKSHLKRYQLTLSDKLKKEESEVELIGKLIATTKEFSRIRTGSVSTGFAHYMDSLDNNTPAKFLYRVPKEMIYTDRLELKLNIRRFRAYSKAIQGGGATVQSSSGGTAHSHNLTIPNHTHGFNIPSLGQDAGATAFMKIKNATSAGYYTDIPNSGSIGGLSTISGGGSVQTSTNESTHTHNTTLPNHVHGIDYGIFENSSSFSGVKIIIDGTDYASELGTYNTTGFKPVSGVFDLMLASSNLSVLDALISPGEHTFEVQCSSGLVMVEMFIYYQFYLSSR